MRAAHVDEEQRDVADARWRFRLPIGVLALAAFSLVGTVQAGREQGERHAVDAVAVLLILAGPAALLWVRRYPVQVLAAVAAVALTYLLLDYPYGPVFLSLAIALFMAVLLGHRLAAWLIAGTVYVAHLVLGGLVTGEAWAWRQALGVAAWTLLVLVAGEVVRVRRDRALDARRARDETRRRQETDERLRIARELHDVVAHHMSLINVQAGVALHLVDRKPDQAQIALSAIKDASREALTELRSLVGVLRDETDAAPRAPISMLDSLDDLVQRSAHAGLAVHLTVDGERCTLPTAVQLAAVRIVQEAITNVVRHAGAARADVLLDYGADVLVVRVDDDGDGGQRLASLDEGSGLRGMRERAAALGGTLSITASPAGGMRVESRLPVGEPG